MTNIKVIIDFGLSYVKVAKNEANFTAKTFKTPGIFPLLNSLNPEKPLSILAKHF